MDLKRAGPIWADGALEDKTTGGFHMAQSLVHELNIVIVHAPDLAAERAFYEETLGLTVESEGQNFLAIRSGDGQGTVLGVSSDEPETAGRAGAEIWWRTDDADALHAALVARGVRILQEPKDEPFGRSISFADPAGNPLYAYKPR